jgi:hypothetical protein
VHEKRSLDGWNGTKTLTNLSNELTRRDPNGSKRSKYCVLQITVVLCHIFATRDSPCRHRQGYVFSR